LIEGLDRDGGQVSLAPVLNVGEVQAQRFGRRDPQRVLHVGPAQQRDAHLEFRRTVGLLVLRVRSDRNVDHGCREIHDADGAARGLRDIEIRVRFEPTKLTSCRSRHASDRAHNPVLVESCGERVDPEHDPVWPPGLSVELDGLVLRALPSWRDVQRELAIEEVRCRV
jgi:hypothetical protein